MITDLVTKPLNYINIHRYELGHFLNGDLPKNFEINDDNMCLYIYEYRSHNLCQVFQIKNGYPVYHGYTSYDIIFAISKSEIIDELKDVADRYFCDKHSYIIRGLNSSFRYKMMDVKDSNDSDFMVYLRQAMKSANQKSQVQFNQEQLLQKRG